MLKSLRSFASLFAFIATLLLAACGGGGDAGDEPLPLANATEVKAAFDQAPRILENYFSQSAVDRGNVEMIYLEPSGLNDPWHLVVTYKKNKIYDNTMWAIYNRHGIAKDGTDVVLLSEYTSPGDWSGSSVVFIDGEKAPSFQSLPADFGQYGNIPATIRDVREHKDGWLIIQAVLAGRGGFYINRWAMYRPSTKEFIDCGEFESNRHSDWGPPASPVCVRKN